MTDFPAPLTPQTDTSRSALWQALNMAWELGYLIVVPLLIFGLGGRWLDHQLHTGPWLFLGGMALAVVLTTVLLVRKFAQILRSIEQSNPPKTPPSK